MARQQRTWIEWGYRDRLLDGPMSVSLDHFRWIAALVVATSHLREQTFPDAGTQVLNGAQKLFYFATLFADEAVVVFFVLSGLLVGGTVLRDVGAGRFVARKYLIARAARLYVALAPAMVLAVVMQAVPGGYDCRHGPDGIGRILGNALFLQNFTVHPLCNDHPLWSLSSEAYYYLVAPPLIMACVRRTWRSLAVAGAALLPAAVFLRFEYLTAALGLILWLTGLLPWLVRVRLPWVVAGLPFVASLVVGRLHLFPHRFEEELLLAPAFALLLCSDFAEARVGGARLAKGLAAFSYSLYLTHMPIAQAVTLATGYRDLPVNSARSYAIYGATVAGMLAVGWLFGVLFEARTPWLRRWLERWSEGLLRRNYAGAMEVVR